MVQVTTKPEVVSGAYCLMTKFDGNDTDISVFILSGKMYCPALPLV